MLLDVPEILKKEKVFFSEWKNSLSDWEFNSIADGISDILKDAKSGDLQVELEDDELEDDDIEPTTEKPTNDPIKNLRDALRIWVLAKLKEDEDVLPRSKFDPATGLPIAEKEQPKIN